MSKITLTDRISVSVRAKTDTQSNQQKVDTGKNIAKSLGVDDYNDTDAATIGNTSKPTITDENGNEWVSMQDIIDAGKKMNQDGAFDEKTTRRYGKVAAIPLSDIGYVENTTPSDANKHPGYGPIYYNDNGTIVYGRNGSSIGGAIYYVDADGRTQYRIITARMGANGQRGVNSGFYVNPSGTYGNSVGGYAASFSSPISGLALPLTYIGDVRTDGSSIISGKNVLEDFGEMTEVQTGGSLIDWTKPDDEIEEDIRQLHETWDVSEHEGAATANGTYVLAGPIEYNPGD